MLCKGTNCARSRLLPASPIGALRTPPASIIASRLAATVSTHAQMLGGRVAGDVCRSPQVAISVRAKTVGIQWVFGETGTEPGRACDMTCVCIHGKFRVLA